MEMRACHPLIQTRTNRAMNGGLKECVRTVRRSKFAWNVCQQEVVNPVRNQEWQTDLAMCQSAGENRHAEILFDLQETDWFGRQEVQTKPRPWLSMAEVPKVKITALPSTPILPDVQIKPNLIQIALKDRYRPFHRASEVRCNFMLEISLFKCETRDEGTQELNPLVVKNLEHQYNMVLPGTTHVGVIIYPRFWHITQNITFTAPHHVT